MSITERAKLATSAEVADYLGIPEKTIAQWRYLRIGPKSIKVGRYTRYRWSDVDHWLDEHERGGAAA
ncbi:MULTISPECIES: helix-turn-helix transcriptional regulator [Streptomyces]|uniref:helix-turn-helix transcriptional regulator n=1 Tax=Streptomyces TaxID=1883 RepID=UPI001FFC8E16|nr:helix-turn-helix domain-containing protein [Streptomyces sp. RK75]